MGKAKSVSFKEIVAQAYVRIRDNEVSDSNWIKNQYSNLTVSFENIDTDRFMTHCNLSFEVRRTTSERYLRKFRAIDRRNKHLEKDLASVKELVAKA